jgi:hypothetical protein
MRYPYQKTKAKAKTKPKKPNSQIRKNDYKNIAQNESL